MRQTIYKKSCIKLNCEQTRYEKAHASHMHLLRQRIDTRQNTDSRIIARLIHARPRSVIPKHLLAEI